MKKVLSIIMAVLTVMSLACPVWAMVESKEEELLEINGVYIPADTECVREGEATVYYNFYDPVNDMNYAFFNSETCEHFAISGPQYETVGTGARAVVRTAHNYSFNPCYTVNGKKNGVTFTLPAKTVHIEGNAQIISASTDEVVTDYYDDRGGYNYTIQVKEDVFLFPQSNTFSAVAGEYFDGRIAADGGTYYLIINPEDAMEDWHRIKGSGKLYYVE